MSDAVIDFPSPPPAEPESKHERFLRLAPKRVQAVWDALERVGKLSLSDYEYSEEEAFRIVFSLQAKLDEVEKRLSREKPKKYVFSFD